MVYNNPNTIKSYKILQKLSPKHAAHGVAQSTYPNYRHGKACLSKQPPWRAAGDPRLARGRSRVRTPGPAGALSVLFFSTLPSFLLPEIVFFRTFPTNPAKVLVLYCVSLMVCSKQFCLGGISTQLSPEFFDRLNQVWKEDLQIYVRPSNFVANLIKNERTF